MINITTDILLRALTERGNTARIKSVMRRAENGERLTIAAIGGSITEGARAGSHENCWFSLTAKWWSEKFPNARINPVNAGIGATGSTIGVFRLDGDVLMKNPDLVIVEYAVNDYSGPLGVDRAETYEAILRRCIERGIAVVMLMLPRQEFADYSPVQRPLGHHYRLPMISVADALYPRLSDNTIEWSDYAADSVHPNADGHAFIASLLCEYFESVRIDHRKENEPSLPAPLTSQIYNNAEMLDVYSVVPNSLGGFTPDENAFRQFRTGWVATAPAEPLVFELECNVLMLLYRKSVDATYGKCRVTLEIDGESRVIELDSYFEGGWGDFAEVANLFRSDDLKRVRVTLTPESGKFALLRLMTA